MTQDELAQFIDAVVQASQFSPRAGSKVQDAWRKTIARRGGQQALLDAINKAQGKQAA